MSNDDGARGAPPDVAALLARVEEIYSECKETGLPCRVANSHASPTNWQCMDCENPMFSPMDRDRAALALVPALATALRAALADQRRYQWMCGDFVNCKWADVLPWLVPYADGAKYITPDGLNAALDAAMTADGGGV